MKKVRPTIVLRALFKKSTIKKYFENINQTHVKIIITYPCIQKTLLLIA